MHSEENIRSQLLKEIKALKHRKGFLKAGLPNYDRLFGRDALISSWQLLDWNPGICKATLSILSRFQGEVFDDSKEEEPGRIIHETDLEKSRHPDSYYPFPYYGSIDSTPLYLIVFAFYFRKTEDKKFLKNHWENILMGINWMTEYGQKNKDIFIEHKRSNPKGLFYQGWKDGFSDHLKINAPIAMVEAQGYQYLALEETAFLSEIRNDLEFSEKLKKRAAILKEEFNKKFWMESLDVSASFSSFKASYEKYFALALDGNKKQRKAITSNPGHLLFTGILEKDRADLVVKRLFQPDLWTNYGIRTHSTREADFDPKSYHLGSVWPHDNWIIAQGLKKLGYEKEYQEIKKAMLKAYNDLGFLPEYYGVIDEKITVDLPVKPCHPQAWASCALFNFLGAPQQKKIFSIPSRFFSR